MFKVPEGFWVHDQEIGTASAKAGISLRYGFSMTNPRLTHLDAHLDDDHRVCAIVGAVGAGKSSLVNTLLYNILAVYSPATLEVRMTTPIPDWHTEYRCRSIVDARGDGMYTLAAPAPGKSLLYVVDGFDMCADIRPLLNYVQSTSNVYAIVATQAPERCMDVLELADFYLCLRCSAGIAKRLIKSTAPSEGVEFYGQVWYYDGDERIQCNTPYIPDFRFFDSKDLMKRKALGKAPANAQTLLQKLNGQKAVG